MRAKFLYLIIPCIILLSACKEEKLIPADTIYLGGDILTMEGDSAWYVEAMAVSDGKISYMGSVKETMRRAVPATKRVHLKGRTLTPGFIDAHGHFASYIALASTVSLLPPPYGSVTSIPELQQALRNYIKQKNIPPGMVVVGNSYDDAIMVEHRHPTAKELDDVSTDHPIYIVHTSGHIGVANSLYMKKMGLTNTTPDPAGGTLGRNPKTRQLNGKMIENANMNALFFLTELLPPPASKRTDKQRFEALTNTEQLWFENGQTTICEGRATPDQIAMMIAANKKRFLKGDYIVLPDFDANKKTMAGFKHYYKRYDGHFKIGGMKMTFDGSPQGKSAWLTQPYLIHPAEEQPHFKGRPIYTHKAAYEGLKSIFELGMQVHIHCNGDAAIDEGLHLLDTLKRLGWVTKDMRNTLIHTQVCRPDQVVKFKQFGVIPSWFPTHCYLWGDWYEESVLGEPRASHISPLGDAVKQRVKFTIHHDAPVTPPDLFTAMYAAVNRTTRSGRVLGQDQCISPYEALKAITINAAYQWDEEKEKGSLKVGKKADLVILDKNPLKVPKAEIRNIKVMETIKDGKSVYHRR